MATDQDKVTGLLGALSASEWLTVVRGVEDVERWLRSLPPGDRQAEPVMDALLGLAGHRKWEVRHALATLASSSNHPGFEPVLARFVADDNAQVRGAAKRAALRRRDWQNAGVFGRQHEERINATLDDIESKFGVQGRQAVKRASDQIADTFARELYHEIIKVVVPVATAAERLTTRLSDEKVSKQALTTDATTIGRRVAHLKAILDAMRAYTALPKLTFAQEDLAQVVSEALTYVREPGTEALLPSRAEGDPTVAEVARPRIVQALTNLLVNALESYEGISARQPISIALEAGEGWVSICVTDCGCGMREDVLAEATTLFTTNKAKGTGFGLPLVKKIVEAEHSGSLALSSQPGRGTAAKMTIPTRRPREGK